MPFLVDYTPKIGYNHKDIIYKDRIMNDDKQYLSKEKFEELSQELQTLKTVRRKEIAEKLEYAKSLGDLSENAEYQEARDEQAAIEDRIMNLEEIIKSAEIVLNKKSGKVIVGSKVTVQKVGDSKKNEFQLVGSEEADMSTGKISNQSPIGSCLLGSEKGDVLKCETPNGKVSFKVIEVK